MRDVLKMPNDHGVSPLLAMKTSVNSGAIHPVEELTFEEIGRGIAYRLLKRSIDIVLSFAALVVACFFVPFIIVAIRLDSPGPVLYRQERLGLNGKPFTMLKFRSMYIDAEVNGAQWAEQNDHRVTRVGHFLRKSRLDEIPQFLNVLKGDMSLIGPRPERLVFYNEFESYIPGFGQRLRVRPGVSGLAQVSGGYDLLPQEKIHYDVEYIRRRSVMFDSLIALKTCAILLNHQGAR